VVEGVRRHDYLPFGEENVYNAAGGSRTAANGYLLNDGVRQQFVGYERDNETGLDFAEARYFGSLQGRFTSPDPFNPIVDTEDRDEFNEYLGQPQNWNRYAFVWNNPLRYTDPYGERVYVVSYTYGNSNSDESFKAAAETLAKEIQKRKDFDPKKDTVLLRGVYAKDDFKNLLQDANSLEKQFGKVEEVTLFAHSGAISGPVFHDRSTGKGDQFTDQELKDLNVNWSGSASACFIGCNTADNFTQNFANAQGVPTFGYDKYAYFSSSPTKMVPNPKASGPVYLIAADYGTHNGYDAAIRYKLGRGRVYPLVRRDPKPKK
jgi:RHS repeat-associated protein